MSGGSSAVDFGKPTTYRYVFRLADLGYTSAVSVAPSEARTQLRVPGVHGVFHDSAAALGIDGRVAAVFALSQPAGCELRELVVCASTENSWP